MESMRQFAGISLGHDPIPDETTILHFRRLLEDHHLTEALFQAVKGYLSERGYYLRTNSELIRGRGRDGGYPPPPAQIRTSGTTAYGSCLGS
jgi:IS5 family transposase